MEHLGTLCIFDIWRKQNTLQYNGVVCISWRTCSHLLTVYSIVFTFMRFWGNAPLDGSAWITPTLCCKLLNGVFFNVFLILYSVFVKRLLYTHIRTLFAVTHITILVYYDNSSFLASYINLGYDKKKGILRCMKCFLLEWSDISRNIAYLKIDGKMSEW